MRSHGVNVNIAIFGNANFLSLATCVKIYVKIENSSTDVLHVAKLVIPLVMYHPLKI